MKLIQFKSLVLAYVLIFSCINSSKNNIRLASSMYLENVEDEIIKDNIDDDGKLTTKAYNFIKSKVNELKQIGFCIDRLYLDPNISNYLPFHPLKTVFNAVSKFANKTKFTGCIGKFKSEEFILNKHLENSLCYNIPLEKGEYRVIATYLQNLKCPMPVDARFCLILSTDTFAFTGNLGLAACIMDMIAPLAGYAPLMLTSQALKSIEFASLGVSTGNRFHRSMNLLYRKDDKLIEGSVLIKGNLILDLTINLSRLLPNVTIFGQNLNLSSLLKFLISTNVLIEIGRKESLAKIERDLNTATTEDDKTKIENEVINNGSKIQLTIAGSIIINFAALTDSVIPDFRFTLNASALAVLRNDDLDAGLYLYFGGGDSLGVVESVKGFFDCFGDIFKILSFRGLSSIRQDIKFVKVGLLFTSKAIGLSFSLFDQGFKCMFRYEGMMLSCKFEETIFTAIKEGSKFIFRKTKEFFSRIGTIIREFSFADFVKKVEDVSANIKLSTSTIIDKRLDNISNFFYDVKASTEDFFICKVQYMLNKDKVQQCLDQLKWIRRNDDRRKKLEELSKINNI